MSNLPQGLYLGYFLITSLINDLSDYICSVRVLLIPEILKNLYSVV